MQVGRRSTLVLGAFAAPSLPLAAFGLPLVVFLPNFYSEVLALNVAAVGLAFLLVRVLDIMFDPFFGTVLDRTDWKWGRFKPWLVIGAPIVMLATWMLFMAEAGVGLFYLWFWLIVVYAGYSICVLSHTAWAATLSADYHQRSRVYAFWQTGNVVGMILVLLLPIILTLQHLAPNKGDDVRIMGAFIILLLPFMVALAAWRVDEPRIVMDKAARRASLGDYFKLFKRPVVVRLLVADLLMGMAPGIAGSLFFFYFVRIKAFDRLEATILLLIYFMAAIAGAFVWTRMARRMGKVKVLIISSVVYAVVQFAVVTLPNGNFLLAIPFLVLAGLPYSAAPFLLRSMMADVGDEVRLETGTDLTGLLYAILTGTVKVGTALSLLSFLALGWMGFNAHDPAASAPASMLGLQALYAFVPGVLGLLAAAIMIRYPLTEERHAAIRAQLADRDAASVPVVPEDIAFTQPSISPAP